MSKLIILNNKSCQFITDDVSLMNSLRKFLSFTAAGVEFSPAYQAGWDGITYVINKKGIFNAGLLPKVRSFLQNQSIEFAEEDRRSTPMANPEIDLMPKLKKLGMVPREHQERMVSAALNNERGIIRAATGSGKTAAIAYLTAKLNKPTIIYVIGLDLLKQFHDLFSKIFNEPIGYIGNGECRVERINIATIWTIGRTLKIDKKNILNDDDSEDEKFNESNTDKILKMLSEAKIHVLDESHVAASSTIEIIYKNIDPERIYGFSGTPFRDDNTDLVINGILGEKIIDVGASELIEKGLLAQPIIKFVSIPKMRDVGSSYHEVYKNYVVENDIRNDLIVSNLKFLLEKGYTPLVLFKQIKHGKILNDLFKETGIKFEMLYGNDSLERRTEVKQMLIDKKIDVILASTIMDIGVDLPPLNALILCGSGKSSIKCLQRIGRVIRAYPGKKQTAIIDFYDQVKFLKNHSKTRYDIYCSEPGFKVYKCKEMK